MCLETCFSTVPDPRARNVSHRLGDLIVMMVAASLCGATTATEFTLFAEARRDALSRLIDYDTAPSHDTFSRLLRLMDPRAFEQAFARFAEGFARALEESLGDRPQGEDRPLVDVVAIDGKVLRRAYERGCQACPPLTVSAFAARTRLCLAAASPTVAENEIEAALKTIDLIDLTDKIVTADALHCHKRMAEALVTRRADYMLALKGNRHHWRRQAEALFVSADVIPAAEMIERNHGRNEWRKAEVVVAEKPLMPGHAAFIRLTSQRDRQRPLTRLFMASKLFTPEDALAVTSALAGGKRTALDARCPSR